MKELPTFVCTQCGLAIFPFGTLWRHLETERWTCSNGAGVATPPDDINVDDYKEIGMELLSEWGVSELMQGGSDD